MSAPTLEKILQAVNEKYGTSFEGWSQLPTVYEVGDTVPNWNAYEKIEMPATKQNIKTLMPGGTELYAFGQIDGSKFMLAATDEDRFYVVRNGNVESIFSRATEFAETQMKPKLIEAGYNVEETTLQIFSYEVGDEIPEWNSYIEI